MKSLLFFLSFFISQILFGQDIIKWYTWDEGMVKAKEESKKIFIDLYTDWCKWCRVMDKETFQNPVIAEYMNEHYISIKFNAEQREDVEFKGQTFRFVKDMGKNGCHTLAIHLTGGRLSYPTVVFLSEEKEVIQAIPGFLDVPTFDPIIKYFAKNLHKTVPWANYLRQYNSTLNSKDPSDHSRLVIQKKGN